MINNVYQLVGTKTIVVKFESVSLDDKVIVRPDYLAICHADQRYYLGQRNNAVLEEKLPMAPIHEACGSVVYDPSGTYDLGQRVVLIPNIAGNINSGYFENYLPGSKFRSSGYDGFLSEIVSLPLDRVVSAENVAPEIAAIGEFVSVAVHATERLRSYMHTSKTKIAIIGDGSLAYVLAMTIKHLFPKSSLTVIGKHIEKLELFSFVDRVEHFEHLSENINFDYAFECVGSQNSAAAIEALIDHIDPLGTILLLGVNEYPVPINTRMILEKGLNVVGCSRSGRSDFEQAISMMQNEDIQKRLKRIITLDDPVCSVADIKRVFANDLLNPFKTVFEWSI